MMMRMILMIWRMSFNYAQGNSNGRRQWQGEDADLSSSSRHESQQPIPLLTNGQPMSGEIPCATPDNQSVRTTSGPLDPDSQLPRHRRCLKKVGQCRMGLHGLGTILGPSRNDPEQVFLATVGALILMEMSCLDLFYVSREKRPGFQHHKKAGAMNALINLKGLDGIQGPVYVGTGCCFNRQALYGYDPVLTEEDLQPNIIIKSCCGSRKKGKTSNKKYIDKKRAVKRTESTIPIFNMEDIEEGVEEELREALWSITSFYCSHLHGTRRHSAYNQSSTLLKEAIHVISCGYEEKTEWGKEVSQYSN
ncbi:hypothetical protein GBA52_001082 [Prunus armeniaca]|nr:hypothetical protein GBA52_001082 [Prunus armeniaca]